MKRCASAGQLHWIAGRTASDTRQSILHLGSFGMNRRIPCAVYP